VHDAEVVIVGAGIAGSALAATLEGQANAFDLGALFPDVLGAMGVGHPQMCEGLKFHLRRSGQYPHHCGLNRHRHHEDVAPWCIGISGDQ
jgi:hypothetical protein